jgi:hypothetical protein
MNSTVAPSLEQVRNIGVPVGGLPDEPPTREGFGLVAIVTNSNGMQFVVAMSNEMIYRSYREMTKHAGDQGNWFFEKMELFFMPNVRLQEQPDK